MELIEALNATGIDVQLKHDDTETTREEHGWVCIKTEDGKELVREEDVMHNRNYHARVVKLSRMTDAALEALASGAIATALA